MLFGGNDPQDFISNRLPMPIDIVGSTAQVLKINSETLKLYYFNNGVPTIDAGQAAGTVVIAKFLYSGILDRMGAMLGNEGDSSVAFTTGTVLTTAKRFQYRDIEDPVNKTLQEIALDVTSNFSNGDYCIDYRNGVLYGKKATTGVSDVVSYKVKQIVNSDPGSYLAAVTPHDATNFTEGACRALYVGGAGNIVVVPPTGSAVTLTAVPAGTILPIRAIRVNTTNTTATNIVAIF